MFSLEFVNLNDVRQFIINKDVFARAYIAECKLRKKIIVLYAATTRNLSPLKSFLKKFEYFLWRTFNYLDLLIQSFSLCTRGA